MEYFIVILLLALILLVAAILFFLAKILTKQEDVRDDLAKVYAMLDNNVYNGVLILQNQSEHMSREQGDIYTLVCKMNGTLLTMESTFSKRDNLTVELLQTLRKDLDGIRVSAGINDSDVMKGDS